MKTATAKIFVEAICMCPNCDFGMDVIEEINKSGQLADTIEYGSSSLDLKIVCDGCNETFLVTDINY